jgi:hypothetical protein
MNELFAIEKIAQWEKLKTLVLDSVFSPIAKRVYNMALNEFMAWFKQAPRPGFTKATVSTWRVWCEECARPVVGVEAFWSAARGLPWSPRSCNSMKTW